MKIIDDLKKMKKKGRQVVSIDYVLNALQSTEKDKQQENIEVLAEDIKVS